MMYAIAKHLTLAARREAAGREYKPAGSGRPRTDDGYCPLGVAMDIRDGDGRVRSPGAFAVASAITPKPYPWNGAIAHGKWGTVHSAADDFITDWDAGRITDLADALGVGEAGA